MVMVFGFLKVTFPSNSQEESIATLCKALLNSGSQRVWPWPAATLPGNRENASLLRHPDVRELSLCGGDLSRVYEAVPSFQFTKRVSELMS